MAATLEQLESSPTAPPADDHGSFRDGIIHTAIAPRTAWAMIVLFLLMVFGVPLSQVALELRAGRRPGVIGLDVSGGIPARGELERYEDALQEQSLLVRFCQPRVQEMLSAYGQCGSAAVVLGREGWLFYRPGIDSVTGPGFLEPDQLRRRSRNWREAGPSHAVQPDPRPAILQFKRQLEAAGVQLILLPILDKASLQGDRLSSRVTAGPPLQNSSFDAFIREMREAGVEVIDPSPPRIVPGEARYLAHDTHWTPQYMDETARQLASRLRREATLPRADLRIEEVDVAGEGDLVELLRLTEAQRLFPQQAVRVGRVLDSSGQRLRPSPASPILLLGDSFANIYSARLMGWGDGAGLAEHASYHLGHPIDWMARNDAGAHATRQMLAQNAARLAGKKVVVWQFAARELALGDWRMIELPPR